MESVKNDEKRHGDTLKALLDNGEYANKAWRPIVAGIPIWLDVSMKRFEYVHPAGGNGFTSVKLSPDELEKATDSIGWCDVCKGWEE